MRIPTKYVRVLATGQQCRINESDFDTALHKALAEPSEAPEGGSSVTVTAASGNRAAVQFDETPGSIATVNVEDALELIAQAETIAALDALEAAEESSIKNKNGRKAVLRAIKERRAELQEG